MVTKLNDTPNAETDTDTTTADPQAKRKIQRLPPLRALPTERFSFEGHWPVIVAFVLQSKSGKEAVETEAVENAPGIRTQQASLNVRFFEDLGLLVKEKRAYRPTSECIDFVRFLKLDEARAKATMRGLVTRSWFGIATKEYLEVALSPTEEGLIKHLAVEAGVFDLETKGRGVRILLDYMAFAGVISRDGEALVSAFGTEAASAAPVPAVAPSAQSTVSQASAGGRTSGVSAAPMIPAPPAGLREGEWLHQSWPGFYNLSVKLDEGAIKMLEMAVAQAKIAVELHKTQKEGSQ